MFLTHPSCYHFCTVHIHIHIHAIFIAFILVNYTSHSCNLYCIHSCELHCHFTEQKWTYKIGVPWFCKRSTHTHTHTHTHMHPRVLGVCLSACSCIVYMCAWITKPGRHVKNTCAFRPWYFKSEDSSAGLTNPSNTEQQWVYWITVVQCTHCC